MGSCVPESLFIGDNCKILCNSEDEESCGEHEDFAHDTVLEDLCILGLSDEDYMTIEELEDVSDDTLDFSGSHECLCDNSSTTSQDGIKNEAVVEETAMITCALKNLDDFQVYQSAEEDGYSPFSISVKNFSTSSAHAGSNPESELKLISALKGSRAQDGLAANTKLSVKWAPDVYDPPHTSESHTVKGQRRHSKLVGKDYHKQKHSKSSPSRSHTGDKRQALRRSSRSSHSSTRTLTDPRISRSRFGRTMLNIL